MARVLKFGGSSLADADGLRRAAERVREALPSGPVVVLSAMGGTTDVLFGSARVAEAGDVERALEGVASLVDHHVTTAAELFDGSVPPELTGQLAEHRGELEQLLRGVAMLRELSARSMDAIACQGEVLCTRLFAAWLRSRGVDVTWLDARRVVRTDSCFGSARPDPSVLRAQAADHLTPHVGRGRAVVTQGYVGADPHGVTTTLGRGGSDYSAALLGAAIEADEVQIWTDVEGVYTADPRVIQASQPIPVLSFHEAAELAAFGARVLHPATIQPAVEACIPVTVRHTRRPQGNFTTIRGEVDSGRSVTALASRGPIAILNVTSTRMLAQSGFLARLFEVFGRLGVSVDLVATAEVSVSLSVEADAPLEALREELSQFAMVEVYTDRSIVAIVGERLRRTCGVSARALHALGDINVEMISMGANEINLSLVVARQDEPEALRRLHGAFFE